MQLVAAILTAATLVNHATPLDVNEAVCKTQLQWFHPPKTGSGFCTTISHVCCSQKFDAGVRQLNQHEGPYKVSVEAECALPLALKESGNACHSRGGGGGGGHAALDNAEQSPPLYVVGLFRHPLSRVLAAFFDGASHTEGLSEEAHARLAETWSTYHKPKTKRGRREMVVRKACDYAMHPHVVGCYTKMLLGYPCHSSALTRDQPFNATALAAAVARLRTFFFVGVFEEYEESVSLFHRLTGGRTTPHWTEWRGPRAQNNPPPGSDLDLHQLVRANVSALFTDPYDDEVYRVARELFAAAKKAKVVQNKS